MARSSKTELLPNPVYTRKEILMDAKAQFTRFQKASSMFVPPVHLDRDSLSEIIKNDYTVTSKSNGIRYVLFLTTVSGSHMAFMVNKDLDFFQVPVAAHKDYFSGSLFDGELVWAGSTYNSQYFMVFDVIALNGMSSVRQTPLIKRIERIRFIFDVEGAEINSDVDAYSLARLGKIICGGNSSGLSFGPKKSFNLDMIETLLRSEDSLTYRTDGLIFAPKTVEQRSLIFKLTNVHCAEIECKYCLQGERNNLMCFVSGSDPTQSRTNIQELTFTDLKVRVRLDNSFETDFENAIHKSNEGLLGISLHKNQNIQHSIVQVSLRRSDEEILLSFQELRRDGTHPSQIDAFTKAVCLTLENITGQEIAGLVSSRGAKLTAQPLAS